MSLEKLFEQRLPINRKERYYTATVLPGIICHDNFKGLEKFLGLLGIRGIAPDPNPDTTDFQLFTEYGLVESIFGVETRKRFPDCPPMHDIPDVLISVRGFLVAIEAKMYDQVTAGMLEFQMERQGRLLSYIAGEWEKQNRGPTEIRHVALLPKQLADTLNGFRHPVITWEEIIDAYRPLQRATYFFRMLEIAIGAYPKLKSKNVKNYDAILPGAEIVHRSKLGILEFKTMGRKDGFDGSLLKEDVKSGRWPKQNYQVALADDPANSNWFPVQLFLDLVNEPRADEEVDDALGK